MIKTYLPWVKWNVGRISAHMESWGRERYIPLKPRELIAILLEGYSEENLDKVLLKKLFKQLVTVTHQQYRDHHELLVSLYHAFDPDSDVVPLQKQALKKMEPEKRDLECRKLFSEIADSLEYANYTRLKPREIQQALDVASHWGVRLRIRFSSFRRLEVYGRGDIIAKRLKRERFRFWKLREVDVPIYQRLVVVFRTKELQSLPELLDPDCVHVRMFKNIPKVDVDMMLPGSQIRMSWVDTGKIGLPTVWGVMLLASKLARSIWLLAMLSAVKFFSSFLLVIAVMIATIFYGVKSSFSYMTAKRRYQLNVARNLYYQNLDNNLGALLRLIEEAEQQESCEAILAYSVLVNALPEYLSTQTIDQRAEEILRAMTGIEIDFDVSDALRDLASIGLVQLASEGWIAIDVASALSTLGMDKG